MIYCFGDSFTWGDELEDRAEAWPGVLAQLAQQSVYNFGFPGASNSFISRKIIEKCLEQKPDLAVVAWTTTDRYEFFAENNSSRLVNVHHGDSIDWVKTLYTEYHDVTGKFVDWLCQAILIQNFFDNQGIDYRFANVFGIEEVLQANTNNEYFQKMLEFLDTDRFIGWPDANFIDWSRGSDLGPNGHFLAQGHQQVAEVIHKHLQDHSD